MMQEDTTQLSASDDLAPLTIDLVVQQYQTRIERYILRLIDDPELALDLTQDTFVSAFRKLHTLRSNQALTAWLYRIATNLALQARWRRGRFRWLSLVNMENSEYFAVDGPDEAVMSRDLVNWTLAQLSRDRAACLLLHFKEGFNYDEVAAILGITPEAARKRITRAKDQFRQIYDAHTRETAQYAVR